MSNSIEIEMPGVTRVAASELDRRADLAGMPFTFIPPRPAKRWASERPSRVVMEDLREDPSIASETLDHPEGWPEDAAVRQWLEQAARFLGDNAPEQRFSFRAGWGDNQRPTSDGETELADFLEMVAAGRLRADDRYTIRSTE